MSPANWRVVVLAAGRGPNDPMAKAFGVAHKCTIPVAGVPMLARVIGALRAAKVAMPILVSIDSPDAGWQALGGEQTDVRMVQSLDSAPASAKHTVLEAQHFPVLITTGDHALLTQEIVRDFLQRSENSDADFIAGLATAEVILKGYPETKRTFFRLGPDRVSGCNLFAVMNDNGLKILDVWQHLERNRKKPWKLVAAFGLKPLWLFATGQLNLERAFTLLSTKLNSKIRAALLPNPEAAIDIDKPSDHALAEKILLERME